MAVLKGGPELRARLASLADAPKDMTKDWAEATRKGMETRTGRPIGVWSNTTKGKVYGPFWWIFIDRGVKAHDITPQSISNSGRHWITSAQPNGPKRGYGKPKALAFAGGTIFATKVHKKRQARKPFITAAAQNALRTSIGAPQIIAAWNRKRGRGRGGKLEMAA